MKALLSVSVSRDFCETEFLEQKASWSIPKDWQIKIGLQKQFTAQERHNVAILEAKYNYDRVLFMDTDQIYPFDYLEMMLAHEEPIVSALNVSRYHPYEITTYKYEGEDELQGIKFPKFTAIMPPENEKIFECDIVGTGALMVDPSILAKLPMPYFKDIYDAEGCKRLCPDDFYFGWLLHKAGIRVTVDQSIIVKHVTRSVVSPFNNRDMRRAWEKINSGHGFWKDGKKG